MAGCALVPNANRKYSSPSFTIVRQTTFYLPEISSVKRSLKLHGNVDCRLPPVLSFWMAPRRTREFEEAGLG